jgi:4-amino-4-deoxy-L-arabinose transferase-like glycosyltransferase
MIRRGFPWVEGALLVLLAAILVSGAARVPFHPDETSWLFQSRDLESLVSSPLSLAWRETSATTPELTYRLLNAPLAKYVLGAARLVAGYPAASVATDWNWSLSWEPNVSAGALPDDGLLAAGRVASALLLLPAVIAMYFSGRAVGGRGAGLAAAVLLGLNALVLLHGRRAMAEGALTLAVCLALLGSLHADRHPWLAGAAAGLAFAAKTSAGVWLLTGVVSAAWPGDSDGRAARAIAKRVASFGASAALVILVLHPVLWADPARAIVQMWNARQELVAAQVAATDAAMPWAVIAGPGERAATLLAHLFFAPPQFAEAANYLRQTAAAEAAYLANPVNTLLRGLWGGAILFGLTLLGIVQGVRTARSSDAVQRRRVGVAVLATTFQSIALVLAVPLAFQRYVMPLVPLATLWCGVGIGSLVAVLTRNRRPTKGPAGQA